MKPARGVKWKESKQARAVKEWREGRGREEVKGVNRGVNKR